MSYLKNFLFYTTILFTKGCTYTTAVSQTNFPKNRTQLVEASVYRFIFLGFVFDNEEVFKLPAKLRKKCPEGDIKGILTEDRRILYFLTFFWAQETIVSGYCIKDKSIVS